MTKAWKILPADQFHHNYAAWQALNNACSGSQLLDAEFINAALAHFSSGSERLGIFREHGTITAMGVFSPSGRGSWQTFQPANAPLGSWVSLPGQSLEKFVKPLMSALPGSNVLIGISQQDPDILPPPQGTKFGLFEYIVTSRITITESFEDYWKSRGKNLRHNIKRQRNRLEREKVTVRFEVVEDVARMAETVLDYAELESRGWKGEAHTAVNADDAQARFYVQILEHFATRGEAAVWRYFFDDVLAACDICVQRNGILVILKTAYEESLSGYSPAQLLRHEAFQRLFDGGHFKAIEFYGPAKDWHRKWTDEIRTMYHANYYRNAVVKALHYRKLRA